MKYKRVLINDVSGNVRLKKPIILEKRIYGDIDEHAEIDIAKIEGQDNHLVCVTEFSRNGERDDRGDLKSVVVERIVGADEAKELIKKYKLG